MTHPAAPEVGGEAAPASDNPFEAIADEMLGNPQDEEEESEAQPEEGDEPETAEAEDDISEEDIEQEEIPAIDPPNSLTAEEKEAFKSWPREAQEAITRRVGELEKGFQSKAQEAAQAREAARTEALQFATQLKAEAVQRLEHYAAQFEVRPPDAALFRANPEAYAQQLEAYQFYTAQRDHAQRDADKARAEQEQYQAALQQHEAVQFRQRLQAELPEAFGADGQIDASFRDALAATAAHLGYDTDAIARASVEELKALKAVSDIKAKADKYDKLMAKQMERVRAGKSLPPVSKPGVAKGPGQNRQARADQAWEAAKTARSRPAKDAALASWMENTGWL